MESELKVLVVDDQASSRELLCRELASEGYRVAVARDGFEGLRTYERFRPDLVVTDRNMPGKDGIALVEEIRREGGPPVIVITAEPTVSSAVRAMKLGATDYLEAQQIDMATLKRTIRDAVRPGRLPHASSALLTAFPGESECAVGVRQRLEAFARLHDPVTITGPRGADRIGIVEALHACGPTSAGRMLVLDGTRFDPTQSVPPSCLIFIDRLECASTRLIDHLERWYAAPQPSPHQAQEVPRLVVGCEGRLDEIDLSPRMRALLDRFVIELPALDDHPEDLAACAEVRLSRIGSKLGRRGLHLTAAALARVEGRRWPFGEAELGQVLEAAVIHSAGARIDAAAIERALVDAAASVDRIRRRHAHEERRRLLEALESTGGNVARASQLLGTSRSAVYRMMDRHGVPRTRRR